MHPKRAPDARIAAVAGRQHGVVAIDQLRENGLSDTAIRERVRAGRLHRIHRGAYAVGHVPDTDEARWMGAVLAMSASSRSGDPSSTSIGRAALSHRSAAALWGILTQGDGPVDVSLTSRGGRRKRAGIRVHRPVSLDLSETTRRRNIPVTSSARTISDLRSAITGRGLRRAIRQADFLGLPIGQDVTVDRTRSELERKFLHLCRQHALPKPAVNMQIGAMTVDFCWVEYKLAVETDGYQAHRGREAFESDRARDLRLRGLGYEVLHLSHRQVFEEPEWVLAVLRPRLTDAAGRVDGAMHP